MQTYVRPLILDQYCDPSLVLCLAEGQGRNAVWLAQRGHEVTAMDQSAFGLEGARQLGMRGADHDGWGWAWSA